MFLTRDKEYYRTLSRLAPPIVLGNLLTFSIGFTDHFMTAPLGSLAISGIYLSNQVGMILQFLIVGIESALGIIGAQYRADGEDSSRSACTTIAGAAGLIISSLLTIVCFLAPEWVLTLFSDVGEIIDTGAPFLKILALSFPPYAITRTLIASSRAEGRGAIALISPASSFAVNLGLNFLLIPSLGVRGAATATLAARVSELAVAVIYTIRTLRSSGTPITAYLKVSGRRIKAYALCAMPILGGQAVWAASNFFTSALMSRVSGGDATAAVGVALSLGNLAYALMNAASASVGVIISRSVGRGDEESVTMRYANTSELLFLLVGGVALALILLLSRPFIALYRLEGVDAELAASLVRIVAVSFVAISYSAASLFGIIKSGGEVGFAALCDLASLLLVTLPLGITAYRLGASPVLLFAVLRIEHLIKCVVAAIKIRRGNWMKRLSRGAC